MKVVSEIVSYILIILLVISLISFILSWGIPYLQKRQDEMKVRSIFNSLFDDHSSTSIPALLKKILIVKSVEMIGGYEGFWNVSDRYITFSFFSRFSPLNSDDWITIYGCLKDVCEFPLEPFYEVQAISERIEDTYLVRYRVVLKKININDRIYEIKFENSLYLNSKYISISFNRKDDINNVIYLNAR